MTLCLDVEHAVKTRLMAHITENKHEDGYKIVDKFKQLQQKQYQKCIEQFKRNSYKEEMWDKRKEIPIWVFLEIIGFGNLIMLISYYEKMYPGFKGEFRSRDLKYIKNIRNSCAHNDVYFINVFSSIKSPESSSVSYANHIGIGREHVKHKKTNDLVILFYLHKKLCSEELNNRRFKDGQRMLKRVNKNYNLYSQSPAYHYFFNIISKCVDYLVKI